MLGGWYLAMGSRKEKPLQFMFWHSDIPEAASKTQLNGIPSFLPVEQQSSPKPKGYIGFNSSKHGKSSSGTHSLK